MSVKSSWTDVSFKSFVSLLSFVLDDLSTGEYRVLMSPTVIVLVLTPPLSC